MTWQKSQLHLYWKLNEDSSCSKNHNCIKNQLIQFDQMLWGRGSCTQEYLLFGELCRNSKGLYRWPWLPRLWGWCWGRSFWPAVCCLRVRWRLWWAWAARRLSVVGCQLSPGRPEDQYSSSERERDKENERDNSFLYLYFYPSNTTVRGPIT